MRKYSLVLENFKFIRQLWSLLQGYTFYTVLFCFFSSALAPLAASLQEEGIHLDKDRLDLVDMGLFFFNKIIEIFILAYYFLAS